MTTPRYEGSSDDVPAIRELDRRIRECALSGTGDDPPEGLERRVLAKVRRRRAMRRAATGAAAVVLAIAVGIVLTWTQGRLSQDTQFVRHEPPHASSSGWPASLQDLDSDYLAAPPPVDRLELIGRQQVAMLEYLESLGEEAQ